MRTEAEEEAYWLGYKAYMDEQTGPFGAENPYNTWGAEEPLWEAWKEGYYAAAWDD